MDKRDNSKEELTEGDEVLEGVSVKRPIIFTSAGRIGFASRRNDYAQHILLQCLSKGVTDPNDLRKMAGLKSKAEVFKLLDKMSIRKEYHKALDRSDLSFDYLIGKIKEVLESDVASDKNKLAAVQMLMRSLGVDKYEDSTSGANNWEDTVLKALGEAGDGEVKAIKAPDEAYEVNVPVQPDSDRIRREAERENERKLYE